MSKLEALIKQFDKAIERLEEVLNEPKNSIVRDSAIQRFEFSLDLAWKSVKAFLEEKKGVVCNSPKECFREAFRQGILEYEDKWVIYVDMRNETVHTYKEEVADKIYKQLPEALNNFKGLIKIIKDS